MEKITGDQYDQVCETMMKLSQIICSVGIVELNVSKEKATIFWDTEGGGMIDTENLNKLVTSIDNMYEEMDNEIG